MTKGTVLVIGSNGTQIEVQGGGWGATGQYLNETVVPAMAVIEAGYDVVLATPHGTKPHIDAASDSAQHFEGDEAAYARAKAFFAHDPAMNQVRTLRSVIAGDVATAKHWAEGWLYAGYKMTVFSSTEEKVVEDRILHAKLYFNMVDALQAAGGEVITTTVDFAPNVIVDRELITGQNPRSDHPIAATFVEALDRATVAA